MLTPRTNSEWEPSKRVKLRCAIDEVPPLLHNEKELRWNAGSRRVWIQTDNQLLDHVFCGRAVFDAPEARPLFVRISRRLHELLHIGFLPRMNTVPFVEWDVRELNTVADHAANAALDADSDWERTDPDAVAQARSSGQNLRVCVDGALRGGRAAAGGLAIYAYPGKVLLCRAGKRLGTMGSSFLVEALALEWALDLLFARIL